MVPTFTAASMRERRTREHGEHSPIPCRSFVDGEKLEAGKKNRYNEE